jgi:hypothetical protein
MDKSTPVVGKARRYFRSLIVSSAVASALAATVLIVQFARVLL